VVPTTLALVLDVVTFPAPDVATNLAVVSVVIAVPANPNVIPTTGQVIPIQMAVPTSANDIS